METEGHVENNAVEIKIKWMIRKDILTSCFGLMTVSAVVVSALYQMDVPALSYIYAANPALYQIYIIKK